MFREILTSFVESVLSAADDEDIPIDEIMPRALYHPDVGQPGVPFWYSHEPVVVSEGMFGVLTLSTRARADERAN